MKKYLSLLSLFTLLSCGNSIPDNSDVKEAARAVIIHNLNDPTSAEFHHNEVIKDIGDSTFIYTETINAKNSFGGSVKQNATVKIKWAGGKPSEIENWRILDIKTE